MKFVALIALGTLVFLSSDGHALDDDFSNDNQGFCSPTLPLEFDETTDILSLGSQSTSLESSSDDLRRPGGDSPHIMGHLSDLLRTTPRSLGSEKLKCTRGTTFCYRQPDESDSDLEPSGSQD